jgi:phenylalanine-4-hydroxylase
VSPKPLPDHLKKYIVDQSVDKYTPVDHAVWRFILRQLKNFLRRHAHESYIEGLEKTGISIEEIPSISSISEKLEKFGWRALPVSGFIPPAAFMELQALCILPIASDMRTLEHLLYTPAPDIVHEAAGHAPMLANKEYANYLKAYAEIARFAILSSEDLELYEAIRILSDLKEDTTASVDAIQAAQDRLNTVAAGISWVSEGAQLARMNWWTAEYGLVGDLNNPKIYGAGLLSSVGESRWCLSEKVKKIPLSISCVDQAYDITEPQPQLFVVESFKKLNEVLEDFAKTMAFKVGGLPGLKKALKAKTVNTVQTETGLQISGRLCEILTDSTQKPCYLRFDSATQISFQFQELEGHSKTYHKDGFGMPVGQLTQRLSPESLNNKVGQTLTLTWNSGLQLSGKLQKISGPQQEILSFTECTVRLDDRILFAPDWGTYDLVLAERIPSVFGGPADRLAYGFSDEMVVLRVPEKKYTQEQIKRHQLYAKVRHLRQSAIAGSALSSEIQKISEDPVALQAQEWLLCIECVELLQQRNGDQKLIQKLKTHLISLEASRPDLSTLIQDGLSLSTMSNSEL